MGSGYDHVVCPLLSPVFVTWLDSELLGQASDPWVPWRQLRIQPDTWSDMLMGSKIHRMRLQASGDVHKFTWGVRGPF